MSGPPRDFTSAQFFHLINRALDSHDLFVVDQDFALFERNLAECVVGAGARVHAYALMSNHFHLLVEPAACPDLSAAMGQLQSRYSKAFNRRNLRRGALFDRRFLGFEVVGDGEFHRVSRYIHANPVAIAGRTGLASYRWCSLPVYLGRRTGPEWLTTEVLAAEIHPSTYLGSVLHDDPGAEIPTRDRPSIAPVSFDSIIDMVERRTADRNGPGDRYVDRMVSFFALDFRAADAADVARYLSCSPSTVRRHASRMRDLRRSDESFARMTDRWSAELRIAAQRSKVGSER